LSMLAAAAATWSATARAQASKSSFDQWVAAFRARRAHVAYPTPRTHGYGQYQTRYGQFLSSSALSPNSTNSSGNTSIAASPTGASRPARRRRRNTRRSLPASRRTTGSTAGSCSGSGASNRPSAIRTCRRTTCAVIPALAALAWGEPRRRAYWEQELAQRTRHHRARLEHAEEMRGSWAGAMGHTQWMPEVWLNVGLDYDGTGGPRPSASPTTRSPARRNISSSAASIALAALGLRSARGWRDERRRAVTNLRKLAEGRVSAPTARRFRSPMHRQSFGCRCRADRRPARSDFYAVRSYNPR